MFRINSFTQLLVGYMLCYQALVTAQSCGEHGTYSHEHEKCICNDSTPSKGSHGFVGERCEIEVIGVELNDQDMTVDCGNACNLIKPDSWKCFYARLHDDWHYLTMELTRVNDEGDPDLYGLFDTGSSKRTPIAETTKFDFDETSSGNHPRVSLRVSRKEAEEEADAAVKGVWMCVNAYGKQDVEIALRGLATLCPSIYAPSGIHQCSSPGLSPTADSRYSECTAAGVCMCKGAFQRPSNATAEGLGFEDCSATVVRVEESMFRDDGGLRAELKDQVAHGGQWTFYEFNVTQQDFQVEVALEVALDEDELGAISTLEMYARYGTPPSFHFEQWDFSQGWSLDYTYFDLSDKLTFDANDDKYRPGTWFVGVYGTHENETDYVLTINKYGCPMNCNGHGSCQGFSCQCNEGYAGADCSVEHTVLQYEKVVEQQPSYFEYDFFTLPSLDARLANRSVSLEVEVSYWLGDDAELPLHMMLKPELLLIKSQSDAELPSVRNYTFKHMLAEQNVSYHATLTAKESAEGVWHLALYNPGELWPLGYKIVVHRVATCPGNSQGQCGGHGTCNEDGECECQSSWLGADCSVKPSSKCEPGSMKQQHKPEALGTCWQPCRCHGDECSYDTNSCEVFTCDAESDGRTNLRRVQGQDKCVEDQCTQDMLVDVTDGVCKKKCICPSDGSACTLHSDCDANSLHCNAGFFADPAAPQPRCVPQTCSHGSVQEVTADLGSNAVKAFGACHCNGTQCTVQTSAAQLLLHCKHGYVLEGGVWDDSVGAELGGRCRPVPRGGAPAWGVALGVLLSLLVGAVLGAFGLWYYDQKVNQPVSFEGKGLYQELSVSNGGGSGF